MKDVFTIESYMEKEPWASFLPGIAGEEGIPLWCMYVNRGQAVVSFGAGDKDHAIMEFYPAHKAYQEVLTHGFRTFIRFPDGHVHEAFSIENASKSRMAIRKNSLTLTEEASCGISTEAVYYILPEEPLGALARMVKVTNTGAEEQEIEVCDGMPEVVPYGVNADNLKNMTETSKAFMSVEFLGKNPAVYRVRASMADSAEVKEVAEGNFAAGWGDGLREVKLIVDARQIFGRDTSFVHPLAFEEKGTPDPADGRTSNIFPAAFFCRSARMKPGESLTFYELYGQTGSTEILKNFTAKSRDEAYFSLKKVRAEGLAEELTSRVATRTAFPDFDAYIANCYLDNGLRGGFPVRMGHNKVFYLYSRKHGDLERDYNYFSTLPEYASQGNGNFRDVLQNRREDTLISPFVSRKNIRDFFSLIQPDGANPLQIEPKTYVISRDRAEAVLEGLPAGIQKDILDFLTAKSFTPGRLLERLSIIGDRDRQQKLFSTIMDFSTEENRSTFGEGYWCDHFIYLYDLLEQYLALFPEEEHSLLFDEGLTIRVCEKKILPRAKRYVKTVKGIRQYFFLEDNVNPEGSKEFYRDREGRLIYVSVLEKLLLLDTVKFLALDPFSMGIEMEGGKPGWYDALNGLPGMLGSSVSEALELIRFVCYTLDALDGVETVSVSRELSELMKRVSTALYGEGLLPGEGGETRAKQLARYERMNDIKEAYRTEIYAGISGEKESVDAGEVRKLLQAVLAVLEAGQAAKKKTEDGVYPTYYFYEVTDYTEGAEGIQPKAFAVRHMPDFLEGSVHAMKLAKNTEEAEGLYRAVKESPLYDGKLQMYKVNADLASASAEIGRCHTFTPGWLENESIWLHMEYKYLLEVLRAGLYKEFFSDMRTCLVPFMDPEVYGRSIYENSSFIASSANPDASIHGKGFVARLSGSTAEMLSMWHVLFFGETLFSWNEKEKKLTFALQPVIPAAFIREDGTVSATLFGTTEVCYRFGEKKDYFPGGYRISSYTLTGKDDTRERIEGEVVSGEKAEMIRNGDFHRIDVEIE